MELLLGSLAISRFSFHGRATVLFTEQNNICFSSSENPKIYVLADIISPLRFACSTQTKTKRRGGPGGLNKLCGVSPELQAIVGQPELPRTEVFKSFLFHNCVILYFIIYQVPMMLLCLVQIVKQLWAYIRKNNLQDPSNKRKIICNDELRLVFETDCTDMFKMNKLLAKHIIPLEPTSKYPV